MGRRPAAGQSLILCAKARSLLEGRVHAGIADVKHVALPVLRHRIMTTFHAEAEGIDAERVVDHLIAAIPAPPSEPPRAWSGLARPALRPRNVARESEPEVGGSRPGPHPGALSSRPEPRNPPP